MIGDAIPEFITLEVPSEFQIDALDWKNLPLFITIFDLNGNDNIQNVKYEIRGRQFDCRDSTSQQRSLLLSTGSNVIYRVLYFPGRHED